MNLSSRASTPFLRLLPLGLALFAYSPVNAAELIDPTAARAFADKYCISCHGPDNVEAEIDLPVLFANPAAYPEADRVLQAIIDVTEFEEMPPRKAKAHPTEDERPILIEWAAATINHIEKQQRNDPGMVVMPRLTRNEYDRVLLDLTGRPIAAAQMLPSEGGAGEGFANVGEAQAVSLTHIEKYLAAARFTLRHLAATPAGWAWNDLPLPDPKEHRDVAQNLISQIQQWHMEQEEAALDTIDRAFAARFTYDTIFAEKSPGFRIEGRSPEHKQALQRVFTVLEAAWRLRHAPAGTPVADIAGPLSPTILQQVFTVLTTEQPALHPLYHRLIADWRALPAPTPANASQVHAALARLTFLWSVTGNAGWQFTANHPRETSYDWGKKGDARKAIQNEAKSGRWPITFDVKDLTQVHLITAGFGDFNPQDRVHWQDGVFTFADGRTIPWNDALAARTALTGQAKLINPSTLETTSPADIRLPVPPGATTLTLLAQLPEEVRSTATVQILILPETPSADSFLFAERRYPLGDADGGHLRTTLAHLNRSKATLRDTINYSKKPIPTEGYLTPATQQTLALANPRNDPATQTLKDGNGYPRPFFLRPADLRTIATPADLARIDHLYTLLNAFNPTPAANPAPLLATARGQLTPFVEQAWRRPPTAAEIEQLLALFKTDYTATNHYDHALKQSLAAALTSPFFVYRLARDPATDSYATDTIVPLSDWEIASRLSFALWASIPDQELRELAAAGRLRDPAVLRAQAIRLLKDPRARALSQEFAGQWFRFAGFGDFREPDSKLFPEFTPELAQAMNAEIELFFDDLFRQNRSILRVLNAEDTYANETLARHYGLTGVTGPEMRPVSLKNTERRGVLGMGAVLTKTSGAERTSPVKRGVWVIEEILGVHLPNPPAGVPAISTGERNEAGETIATQLARHRADQSCATCHNKFDPLGIALENYDAVGKWRLTDTLGAPVANTDTTPDGTRLAGPATLTNYLVKNQDEFVETFCRKLLGYLLGRGVIAGDRTLLAEMKANLEADGYRPFAALSAVLASPQYLNRRITTAPGPESTHVATN